MIWIGATRVPRPRASRLGCVRGRLAALPRARRRDRGAAGGARRAPGRPSLRLPPRDPLARPSSRPRRRLPGSRAAGPTSSASPAISPRARVECRSSCELLGTLDRPFVVLGNHDVAVTRDPFSRAAELDAARRCRDPAPRRRPPSSRGPGRQHPARRSRPEELLGRDRAAVRSSPTRAPISASCSATSPGSSARCQPGAFHLVLAGHLHAGQIVLPHPGRAGVARASRESLLLGPVHHRGRRHAHLAGNRDDVRAVPVLRPAGGHGACPAPGAAAGATIDVMEGHSVISADILASYAADAALGIEGVRGVVEGSRPRHHGRQGRDRRRGGRGRAPSRRRLGRSTFPRSARAVQMRVAEYLSTMADLTPATVDVIVDEIGPPPEGA